MRESSRRGRSGLAVWWLLLASVPASGSCDRLVGPDPGTESIGSGLARGMVRSQAGEPVIELKPDYLFFQRLRDGGAPAGSDPGFETSATAFLRLYNRGTAPLHWMASTEVPWLSVSPGTGLLPGQDSVELAATVDDTGLAFGFYRGQIEVADPGAVGSPQVTQVEMRVDPVVPIELGVAVEDLANESPAHYRLTVPAGAVDLEIRTFGGTGDLDLYAWDDAPVQFGEIRFDCVSANADTNEEVCRFADPQAGTWFIAIYPDSDDLFEGAILLATIGGVEWTLEALAGEIDRLGEEGLLSAGIARSLRAKIEAAMKARDSGRPRPARSLVDSLIQELHAIERAGRIDADILAGLVAAAQAVLAGLPS